MVHSKRKHIFLLFLVIILGTLLRLIWLDRFPPALYTDEASQGYNAYSILLTGRDEHGVFLPVSLRSFGDWKPPLPTYLMVPFIKILGLTEVAVRLPSAILGIGTIILSYLLGGELLKERKDAQLLTLLSAFLIAVSPWHILHSRAGLLELIGLFFLEAGIFLFIKGERKGNNSLFILSYSMFGLSVYAYHSLRIVTPLIILFLIFFPRSDLNTFFKRCKFFLIFLLFLSPLVVIFLKESDIVFGRAKNISVFYDQGVKLRQWELITQDGTEAEPLVTRFFHNNVYLFGKNIVQRFLSHFEGAYLLLRGDQSQPFQIPNMGLIYIPDYLLFLIGALILYKEKYHNRNLITFWLLISLIPTSFTFMTPSSNRTFTMITPLMILTSIGLVFFVTKFKRGKIMSLVIAGVYTFSFVYFLKQYFIVLPKNHADFWNYGWKEVVERVSSIESCCKDVIVADVNGMPYIYFLFYKKYDPASYQKEAIRTYIPDRFGFEHVEGFNKYLFPNNFEWKYVKDDLQAKTIYVVPSIQLTGDIDNDNTIHLPNRKPILTVIQND